MLRFSLMALLLVVSLLSIIVAGLAFPSYLWLQIVGSTVLAVLIAASIAAVASQTPAKWFWVGFAIAGWAYVLLAFHWKDGEARETLVTQHGIFLLDRILETSTPRLTPRGEQARILADGRVQVSQSQDAMGGGMGMGGISSVKLMSREEAARQGYLKYAYKPANTPYIGHFIEIGQFAWTLLLACVGGMLSYWLRR